MLSVKFIINFVYCAFSLFFFKLITLKIQVEGGGERVCNHNCIYKMILRALDYLHGNIIRVLLTNYKMINISFLYITVVVNTGITPLS